MVNFEGNPQVNNKTIQLPLNKLEKILPKERIDTLIKKFVSRAEMEMTDVGSFAIIKETVKNDNAIPQISDISLKISPLSNMNNSKERVLEAIVTSLSGENTLERYLLKGNRQEILEHLKSDKFNENFKRFLMDCSDKFEQNRL